MGQLELAKIMTVIGEVRSAQTILVDRCVGKGAFLRG
jgi:hypothetical protein